MGDLQRRCQVCGRKVRVRVDGTWAKHASQGATTCPNSGAEAGTVEPDQRHPGCDYMAAPVDLNSGDRIWVCNKCGWASRPESIPDERCPDCDYPVWRHRVSCARRLDVEPPDGVTVGEYVLGQKRAMVLDLWMATGRDSQGFDPFVDEHGWPLVWALLLAEQRPISPPCMEPTGPEDYCVFSEGHSGPHYGANDVAAPVDLPQREIHLAPPIWTLEQIEGDDDA